MTPEQVDLVQMSFKNVVPIKEAAARLFYARLFELDPSLKKLFRGDIVEQGRKLMAVIAAAVQGLKNTENLLPVLRELGQRHAGYGVRVEDYETVAAALLWTLKQGLGEEFTKETEKAWVAAYDLLSSTMIEAGAREVA